IRMEIEIQSAPEFYSNPPSSIFDRPFYYQPRDAPDVPDPVLNWESYTFLDASECYDTDPSSIILGIECFHFAYFTRGKYYAMNAKKGDKIIMKGRIFAAYPKTSYSNGKNRVDVLVIVQE
ncbi:MAG: hypothetical protein QQN41_12185, partial [Nitrosopumilus sp.]